MKIRRPEVQLIGQMRRNISLQNTIILLKFSPIWWCVLLEWILQIWYFKQIEYRCNLQVLKNYNTESTWEDLFTNCKTPLNFSPISLCKLLKNYDLFSNLIFQTVRIKCNLRVFNRKRSKYLTTQPFSIDGLNDLSELT